MKINLVIDKYHNDKRDSIRNALKRRGFAIGGSGYDMTFFVGGDGTFANMAIKFIDKPVVFLSRHWKGSGKSISYNSQANVNSKSVYTIAKEILLGNYSISRQNILSAEYSGKRYYSIYDFFVERNMTKEALRYRIGISENEKKFESLGISNGFIITTPLGSTGYYSYMENLLGKKPKRIPENSIGIAHILPSHIEDTGYRAENKGRIRMILGKNAKIEAFVERNVGQMLFGMPGNSGIKINAKESIKFEIEKEIALKMVVLGKK